MKDFYVRQNSLREHFFLAKESFFKNFDLNKKSEYEMRTKTKKKSANSAKQFPIKSVLWVLVYTETTCQHRR